MKYEIHNTGEQDVLLSNGSILAPGEAASFEDANVTVGPPTETTLQHVMDKLHALEKKFVEAFKPAVDTELRPPAPGGVDTRDATTSRRDK